MKEGARVLNSLEEPKASWNFSKLFILIHHGSIQSCGPSRHYPCIMKTAVPLTHLLSLAKLKTHHSSWRSVDNSSDMLALQPALPPHLWQRSYVYSVDIPCPMIYLYLVKRSRVHGRAHIITRNCNLKAIWFWAASVRSKLNPVLHHNFHKQTHANQHITLIFCLTTKYINFITYLQWASSSTKYNKPLRLVAWKTNVDSSKSCSLRWSREDVSCLHSFTTMNHPGAHFCNKPRLWSELHYYYLPFPVTEQWNAIITGPWSTLRGNGTGVGLGTAGLCSESGHISSNTTKNSQKYLCFLLYTSRPHLFSWFVKTDINIRQ